MCSIFGLGFLKGHTLNDEHPVREFVRELFLNSMSCGRDASGISFISSAEMVVLKNNVKAEILVETEEYKKAEEEYLALTGPPKVGSKIAKAPPKSIIGHCRFKTKGTEKNNINNHPIVRDNVIGVHNGIIANDDTLFRMFGPKLRRNGQVDSEIIFAIIEHLVENSLASVHEAIKGASRTLIGSFACALAIKQFPYSVWLFKKGCPVDILQYKDAGLVVWSTRRMFIDRAVEKSGLSEFIGEAEEIEFGNETGIGIDLHRNVMHKFQI